MVWLQLQLWQLILEIAAIMTTAFEVIIIAAQFKDVCTKLI